MAADAISDRLGSVDAQGFSTSWDWKGSYISELATEGYERFSQFSASPDTTALFAGPARYTGLSAGGGVGALIPIGLCDNISMSANTQLQRLFEVGSNRSFFTRGKSAPSIQMSKMIADQNNILTALSAAAYRPLMATDGLRAPFAQNGNVSLNLVSEYFAVPFGLLLVMKSRGGNADGYGKVLAAVYLESCMFSNYQFSIASASPVISENVQIEFDRPVPVGFA